MNKAIRTFLLVLMFFICKNIGYAQTANLDSVKVEFAGFGIETFFAVNCEDFDTEFKQEMAVKTFYIQDDLSKFFALIKQFKPQTKQSLDVRGSIIYYYKRKSIKYCFDVFGNFYKDGQLFYNNELLIYVTDKLDRRHPKYLDTLRQQ